MTTFTIPGRLPALNEYTTACRTHAKQGARLKSAAETTIVYMIRLARVKPITGRVSVTFRWFEQDRRRDKDNIRFAAKFILDALVTAGVIEGDGWAHIADLRDEFAVDKRNPRIEVEIREES